MTISRRGLIQSAGAMLAGFAIPTSAPAAPAVVRKEAGAALWCVFIAGNCRTPEGFAAFEAGQQSARDAGFDVLDSMHNIRERSKFLARKAVTETYARQQERLAVVIGPIEDVDKSELHGVAEGIVALWVELP